MKDKTEPTTPGDDYWVLMGEKMFFRDYPEKELTRIFSLEGFKKINVSRTVEASETFGEEHMIEMISKKNTGP